jgi:hypothetical protein
MPFTRVVRTTARAPRPPCPPPCLRMYAIRALAIRAPAAARTVRGHRLPSRVAAADRVPFFSRATSTDSAGISSQTPLPAPLLPPVAEALAAAARLEGVGWVFPPPAGRSSGVVVLFYPAALVDVESYSVLAMHLAQLGHAVVLLSTTEFAIQDPKGALARAAAEAARAKLGLPLPKIILAGNSMGALAAMQALQASQFGADEALPMSEIHGLGLLASRASPVNEGGMDLSTCGVRATLVTATEDRALDSKKLQENLHLLPKNLTHVSIVGGNHAGFGYYDVEARLAIVLSKFPTYKLEDGVATVGKDVQARLAAYALAELASRP